MGSVLGGGNASFEAWDVDSVYRINCESSWPSEGYPGWYPSRERLRGGTAKGITVIECEDHWSTDGDWDDLVVTINVKQSPANTNIRKSASDDHKRP